MIPLDILSFENAIEMLNTLLGRKRIVYVLPYLCGTLLGEEICNLPKDTIVFSNYPDMSRANIKYTIEYGEQARCGTTIPAFERKILNDPKYYDLYFNAVKKNINGPYDFNSKSGRLLVSLCVRENYLELVELLLGVVNVSWDVYDYLTNRLSKGLQLCNIEMLEILMKHAKGLTNEKINNIIPYAMYDNSPKDSAKVIKVLMSHKAFSSVDYTNIVKAERLKHFDAAVIMKPHPLVTFDPGSCTNPDFACWKVGFVFSLFQQWLCSD